MSAADWKVIYRGYSGEELDAEMASLRKSLAGGFVSQGSGSVSHTRDTTELRDRLKAATEVKNERSASSGVPRSAQADFSGTTTSDF
jgi:hypothetical protein